jgi:hypothetical protein
MGKQERQAFEEQQAQIARDREAMQERNLKKMEEEAKHQPTPTIEEIQAATAPRKARGQVNEVTEEKQPDPDKDEPGKDGVAKTSTAADPGNAGKYNTRDMSAGSGGNGGKRGNR